MTQCPSVLSGVGVRNRNIEVRATPKFMRFARKEMSSEVLQELIDTLTLIPEKGSLIVGTGGIRKLRWHTGKSNQGKRGGLRILYYYNNKEIILLITLYKKSDKEDIDAGEKAELRKLVIDLLGAKK